MPLRSHGRTTLVILISSRSIKQEVGYYLHREGTNLGKHRVPNLLLPLALDAQFGTPYPRSVGFDTDTRTHINENPVIRGHDLCFNKTCQGKRLAICAVAGCEKTVRIMTWPWCDISLSKVVSRLDLWNIVLSLVVREIRLAEADTI